MASVDFYLNKAKENDKTIGVNSAKTNKVDYYLNKAQQIDAQKNQNKYLQMLQNDADAQANSMRQPTRAEYNALKMKKTAADQANADAQANSKADMTSSLKHRDKLMSENSQLTLQAQKLARSGVNTEQVNEITNKIKSNNQTIQRINEWKQEQKTKRNITAENAATWIDDAKALSEKPVWDENDKVIAGEMLSGLFGKDILDKAKKTFTGVDYYKDLAAKRDYAGMQELKDVYDALYSRYHAKISAATDSFYKGSGLTSLVETIGAITDNPFVEHGVSEAKKRDKLLMTDAPGAYKAGGVIGNIALMMGINSAVGGVVKAGASAVAKGALTTAKIGGQVASDLVANIATGAISFAGANAIQNMGEAATGNISAKDYIKGIAISGAQGMAGGIAGGLVSTGISSVLMKNGLMTPFQEFIRQSATGMTSATVNQATGYILNGKKPTKEEIATGLATAFAFSMISGYIGSMRTTAQQAARMQALYDSTETKFNALLKMPVENNAEAITSRGQTILEQVELLRSELNSQYIAGQQGMVDQLNGSLDILEKGIQNIMSGYQGTAGATGAADTTAAVMEIAPAINEAITAGVTQTIQAETAETNTAPAEAIPQSTVPATAAQAAAQPVNTETALPTATTETLTQQAAPEVMEEAVKLQNAYSYLLSNTKDTATPQQLDVALKIANRAKELSTSTDGETKQQLEVIDQVMTKYADFYGKKTLPASVSNSNIVLPTAENPTLPEGVNTNGRNDILNGSGERNVSQRSGEQIGRMAESTGESAAINQGARSLEVKNIARHLRTGRVSSIELGVGEKYGTETKKTYLIPQENWTDWMRETDAKTFAETGKHVEYTSGLIEIRGDDGEIRLTRGVRTDEKYIIQADHLKYTIEQLIIHERHHDDSINNPGLNESIKAQIIESFTREEYDKVLNKYMEGLNGLYSTTDVSDDLAAEKQAEAIATIEDEMFADARAGMNSFSAGAVKFEEAANEAANDYLGGSISKENAAAISNKNGPPTRFSNDDEPKKIELPVVYADKENINGRELGNNGSSRRNLQKVESDDAGRAVLRRGTNEKSNSGNVSNIPRYAECTQRQQDRITSILVNSLDNETGRDFERVLGLNKFIENIYNSIIKDEIYPQNMSKYFPKLPYAAQQVLDYMMHENNQTISPVNIESRNEILNSDTDSNGNTLSNEQRKYFANTATLDEKGNIYALYHGSVSELFTVPDMYEGIWLTPDRGYAENYAEFWDSENANAGESDIYSDQELRLYEFYANIQKPFNLGEINGLLKTDYVLDVANKIGANEDTFFKLSNLADRFKGENTYNLIRSHDFITIIREAGYDGMMATENGIRTFCAISSPDQVKLTSNKNPTKNTDIRFSMEDEVEETEDLVALHNLSEDKLHKALMLGGFPMPSIAVTKSNIPHTNFGSITLVMSKDTVNPQSSRKNKVYSADAWTPTFPQTDYEAKPETAKRIRDLYYGLANEYGYDFVKPMYGMANYLDDELGRWNGAEGIIENLANDTDMMNVYLAANGEKPIELQNKTTVSRLDDENIRKNEYFINALGEDVLNELYPRGGENPLSTRKRWADAHIDALKDAARSYFSMYDMTDEQINNVMEALSEQQLIREFALPARNYIKNGPETTRTEPDIERQRSEIKEAVNVDDYNQWLKDLIGDAVARKGIYNNKDYYTSSGNRRSFSQTHYDYTLENIVKAMAGQNGGNTKNVSGFHGVKTLRAATAKEFGSIAEMHENENRLKHLTQEEADSINDKLSQDMYNIMNDIYDLKEHSKYDNQFIEMDSIGEILTEAAENNDKSANRIASTFKKYGYNISNDIAGKIEQLLYNVSQMQVNIFEAKPERAVRFDEVLAAVVPEDTSEYIKDGLKRNGVDVITYEKNNVEDRLAKVNSVDNAKFSMEDEPQEATLPTADDKLQKRQNNKKLSEAKHKEYLENRIAMLSDMDYRKSLLERGGTDAVKANDTEIKKLQAQIDRINGVKPMPKQQKETPKITPSQPTQARAELRNTLLNTFSIPNGLKTETAQTIDNIADRILTQGYIGIDEQKKLFNLLYESGVVTVEPQQEYREAYAQMKNAHIYISPEVKSEFIDSEYNDLRKRAFAAGIYLTSNSNDPDIDSWNMWLAEELPGFFSENDTDMRSMLENIVQTAEEGKTENMSLADYATYMYKTEGIPEDQMFDSLTRQLDYALDSFADKAKFEVKLKDRTRTETAKLKAEIKAMQKKQTETKALKELQQKTLKQLQWLNKNKMKAPADLKTQFEDVLSDIDIIAVSTANEMNWSNKYQATWKDIKSMYLHAKEADPNFLPSKEIEDIISRLDDRKIADMDVDELQKLYKAALGLRSEFYNRNNVLMDDKHRLFSDVYEDAKKEIGKAKGHDSNSKLNYFINYEQLTPMNVLSRMGGWNKNGAWQSMAKQLEEGEVKAKKYFTDGKKYLSEFMKDNDEWFRKADGQGKDGIWYELEVPQLLELKMGDKPIFGDTIKVYMTPMQKVHMYLESKNYDNLRHMAGGRTFADKEIYSKGERTEAFAHGRTIKLAPESVRKIVSDLTEEEKELADLLEKFYNDISSKEINKVSNVLVGYDKAVNKNYAPIFTNKSYTNSEFGKFDVTAEGVGNLKTRQVSANPSLNISAIDAFDKHIDQTSRYIGYAIPVRNWNTLMNWRGKSDSMKSVIEAKWGKKGLAYIDDIVNTLQAGKMADRSVIDKMMSGLLSKYVTATFGFNPGIVFKQAASYPQAASVLGWKNVPAPGRRFGVDTELIYKYTPELDYRTLGYATPETAVLKENPNKLSTNKAMRFTFGGDAIIAMDAATVKRLWPWAENYVRRNYPDLEMGTQEQIDNGESPFYKKVAEVFNEAVHNTQPMYDVMHRPTIMQHSGFTRAFTMFKTVPLSQQNINRQALGELAAAKQKAKEAKTDYEKAEAEKEHKKAANKAAATVTATIASIAMLEAIEFLNQLWKNGAKKYRDENGKFTFGSVTKRVLLGSASDVAGMMIGGNEVVEVLENIFLGEKWYGIDMPGGTQLNEFIEAITSATDTIEKIINDGADVIQNGGDLGEYFHAHGREYAGALKEIIENAATYIQGFPMLNMEKYILGTIQHISPELHTEIEDYFKTPTKAGLKGLEDDQLSARAGDIFDIRGIELSDKAKKSIAELYENGFTDAVPTNIPKSFSVAGEDIALSASQQQTYSNAWSKIISGSIEKLINSSEFANADKPAQEKMLSKLYKYAQEKAKEAVSEYTSDEAKKVDEAIKSGASIVEYAAWSGIISDDDMKQSDKIALLQKQRYSDKAKAALFGSMVGTDLKTDKGEPTKFAKFKEAVSSGLSVNDSLTLYDEDMLDKYLKLIDEDYDTETAFNAALIIRDASEDIDKYKAIYESNADLEDAGAALRIVLNKYSYKADVAEDYDIDAKEFSEMKITLPKYDADGNGSYKQAEVTQTLLAMDLSNDERAVLWQIQTNGAAKNNPFSRSVGQAVINALKASKPE